MLMIRIMFSVIGKARQGVVSCAGYNDDDHDDDDDDDGDAGDDDDVDGDDDDDDDYGAFL